MAEIRRLDIDKSKKEYATDEAGMMADAKDYARRDISTVLELFSLIAPEVKEEIIVKGLVKVKYEQIKRARTERPTWEKYLD